MTAPLLKIVPRMNHGVAMEDFARPRPKGAMMVNVHQMQIVNLGNVALFGDIVEQTLVYVPRLQ